MTVTATRKDVRKWRKAYGLSQAAVASHLGVSRGHYALWEQGRSPLLKTHLTKLAVMCAAPPDQLGPIGFQPASPEVDSSRPSKRAEKTTKHRRCALVIEPCRPEAHAAIGSILGTYFAGRDVAPEDYLEFYATLSHVFH